MVRRASAAGLRLVAAAGNGGPAAAPAYPASYPGVVGVAAVDRLGRLWPQSAPLAAPGVAAPGAGLAISAADGTVEHISGTSYASPLVASLLLTVSRSLPPPSDAHGRLMRGGRPTDRPDHSIPQFDATCR
ncbi:S8 family serine peptidase [Oleomonas cavernae]|uniref:S8 family serine peptidase n=1 Tax=Oleomonas cavernae TaxID=2320859 RepID=UPI001313F5DD